MLSNRVAATLPFHVSACDGRRHRRDRLSARRVTLLLQTNEKLPLRIVLTGMSAESFRPVQQADTERDEQHRAEVVRKLGRHWLGSCDSVC